MNVRLYEIDGAAALIDRVTADGLDPDTAEVSFGDLALNIDLQDTLQAIHEHLPWGDRGSARYFLVSVAFPAARRAAAAAAAAFDAELRAGAALWLTGKGEMPIPAGSMRADSETIDDLVSSVVRCTHFLPNMADLLARDAIRILHVAAAIRDREGALWAERALQVRDIIAAYPPTLPYRGRAG